MADPYEELQQQVQAIIEHGPEAGFGPEAVNSLIENTFTKKNGSYGYAGEYEPNEVVVTEPFEVMKHADIIAKVNTLASESISTSSQNWNDLAAAAAEGSESFRTGIESAFDAGWSGPTATAVQAGVADYTSSATALSTAMTMISNKLLEAHAGFTQTRAAVPPIVDFGLGADMLASTFPSGLPFADAVKEIARLHDEQEEQARLVMRSVYVPGVLQSDAQVPVLPAAHNPVSDGGGSVTNSGLGSGGTSGLGGAGAPGGASDPASEAAAAQTQPGSPDHAGTGQADARSGSSGSGGSGVSPDADGAGATRAASVSGPGYASGGTGTGSGSGHGGSGTGGLGYGGAGSAGGSGYGAGSAGGSGGGSGAAYGGSVLGPPIGGNGTTGGGGLGGGAAAASTAGRAGAHGLPGMGGVGAGGARGAGDNDGEHATPGYLVDVSNGSELIGELPLVAPPVLGG